jgi:hypothetical protein
LNWYRTVPPTPVPNSRAMPGVSTTVSVDSGGGSAPVSTVARSWLKYSPSRLPFTLSVRKELSTVPCTTGYPLRPMYVAWATTPGSAETRAIS